GFDYPSEAPPHNPSCPVDDLTISLQSLFLELPEPYNPSPSPPPPPSSALAVKILAYADDTLVFLQDAADFHLLQLTIQTYMKASNSLLNFHKTAALSLSGKPHAAWQARLISHGITAWHDRTSPSPLTYLGYPICSSIAQRNVAFQKLYTS
ncbi:hypothetical protein, partial, partial [Parasitella parasitica]